MRNTARDRARIARVSAALMLAVATGVGTARAQDGEGAARMEPNWAEVRATGTWRLIHTVGTSGIVPGGGLRIQFSGFPTRVFAKPQCANPSESDYVTAVASRPGATIDVRPHQVLKGGWMAYEYTNIILIGDTPLSEGDTIAVTLGDTRAGSPGARVQRGNELEKVEITCLSDGDGDGSFERVETQPTLDVVGRQAVRLELFAPSMVQVNEPFEIAVVAKDLWRNVAMNFGGAVCIECPDGSEASTRQVTFPVAGKAAKRVEMHIARPGVFRLRAAVPKQQGNATRVMSAQFLEAVREPRAEDGFRPELTAVQFEVQAVRPGDSFRVTTHWRNTGEAAAAKRYRVCLHLVRAPGTSRAAVNWDHDPNPVTTTWAPGREVAVSRSCPVPPTLAEGDYAIRAGLYRTTAPGKWLNLVTHVVATIQVNKSAAAVFAVDAGVSNPILVSESPPERRLYWGDTHVHTGLSGDGAGNTHAMYDYARDVARLDFAAAADHVGPRFPQWKWREIQLAAADHNAPGDFVSILGYEWSNQFHGDKNVYFLRDYEDYQVPKSGEAEDFYAMLRGKDVVVIPHHPAYPIGLRGMDWTRVDTDLIRLVEMCSAHGTAEYLGNPDAYGRNRNMGPSLPGGFAQDALRRGLRVGMICSSDDHSAHAGRSGFLAAVYARELTRQHLFQALRERHCYGTTGARIIVDFRLNGQLMGTETGIEPPPRMQVRVHGTDALDRVEIIRCGDVIYAKAGRGPALQFEFTDTSASAMPAAWYYVRVSQRDGQRAWTSPVWTESTLPFADPAVERIELVDAPERTVRVTVANRGEQPVHGAELEVVLNGPAWSVVPSERQPVSGGIGGLMVKPGLQAWRYRADEKSVNVFIRWGGGDRDAHFTGSVTLHGAERYLVTPFHCEEGDQVEDSDGRGARWDTNAEAGTGDGLNLWVRCVPGAAAWVEVDAQRDGTPCPEQVFARTGKVTRLPFRIDLARTNAAAVAETVTVQTLKPAEERVIDLPVAAEHEPLRTVVAALLLPPGTVQRSTANDVVTFAAETR